METDSDYSINTDPGKDVNSQTDLNKGGRGTRRSARAKDQESVKKRKISTASSFPATLSALVPMKKKISKQLKGCDIDGNISLRVCKAALDMHERYLRRKQQLKNSKGRPPSAPPIKDTVCRTFGIGKDTYTAIISNYFTNREIYNSGKDGSGRSGNREAKDTRIPRSVAVKTKVRTFIRDKRAIRERVTARQVLDYLVKEGILILKRDEFGMYADKKAFEAAYRNVQRFLK